jgi:DNA-binding protein HU-beta
MHRDLIARGREPDARARSRAEGGEIVNKASLIDKIADDAGITKHAAARAVESLIAGITSALKRNQRVTLVGFGTWGVSKRKARTGRNPQTGEAIAIKAKKAVRFKPGKQLESALNRK